MLCTEELLKALKKDLGTVKVPQDQSTNQHVAAYHLQQNLVRKYSDGTISKLAEIAGRDKFLAVNKRNENWTKPLTHSIESNIMERARNILHTQLHDLEGFPKLTLGRAFNVGTVGGGSNIGATTVDIWGKLFKSKLTSTSEGLYRYYKEAICNNETWNTAELVRSSRFGRLRIVNGSNMFYVPKDANIARVAATEPTINMFGQLGYGKLIEKILKQYHDIDLSVQPDINSWFACSGSLNGHYGTIDLQSASDTIGLGLCEYLLPPRMFSDLCQLRSPTTRVVGIKGVVPMQMISTMGNGFTFPLQTLIFASLVLSTYLELGVKVKDGYGKRRYSVFGDDIISDSSAYDMLCSVLTAAGFQVNSKKSFNTGKFRESCGTDFWNGYNVRPVFLQECNSDAHVYSLINRLAIWAERHKLPLRHVQAYLRTLVQMRPIPLYEEEWAGIRTHTAGLGTRKRSPDGHWYYWCLVRVERKIRLDEITIDDHYHGAKLAFLHGTIRAHSLLPREEENNEYKVVRKASVLHWNLPYASLGFAQEITQHCLKTGSNRVGF